MWILINIFYLVVTSWKTQTLKVLYTHATGHKINRKTHRITWLREKSENNLRKSTEFHHTRTLCQRIMWSCLIHFLFTVSTSYFSQLLEIAKCPPYFLPHRPPIAISPWSLPDFDYYFYRLVCKSTWLILQSHTDMRTFSPTEISHGRKEKGGRGRKWWHGFITNTGRHIQALWHHFHPFYHHHPSIWFYVRKISPPPLQIIMGKLIARMVHMQWSLEDLRRIRLSV